jgi:hypothetical protein
MKRKKIGKKKLDTNYVIVAERGDDDSQNPNDKKEVTAKEVLRPRMPGRRKALF